MDYLGFLNSSEDPSSRHTIRVRSFRTAGRKVEGHHHSALAVIHLLELGVEDLAQNPCVPRGVVLIVGTGNPASKLGVGPEISDCPDASVQREA